MRRLQQIHKVQELVYELKVRDASVKTVITIPPDTMMSKVRSILRSSKITAAPVIRGGKLLGIVSVEDYINWLQDGVPDGAVTSRMATDLICIYDDEPLVDAIQKFEEYRYYEFPVLDRKTNKLVGVITKFDVIVCLLKALDIDYYKKEIDTYQGGNIFKELVSDRICLYFSFSVPAGIIEKGGEVASKLKRNLAYMGIHPDIIRRVAIITYEAEMNLIIYGGGGMIDVALDENKVVLEISDQGPGIEDVEEVMIPGYSTAPDWIRELGFGAGMGLPNIKKNSQHFEITSTVGKGTSIISIVPLEVK